MQTQMLHVNRASRHVMHMFTCVSNIKNDTHSSKWWCLYFMFQYLIKNVMSNKKGYNSLYTTEMEKYVYS